MLSFLKNKSLIWLVLATPLYVLMLKALVESPLTPPFWNSSLAYCGYSAATLLALSLSLTPLVKNFPKATFFGLIHRHRRAIGLSCFFYAVLHVTSILTLKWLKTSAIPWDMLTKPFVLIGLTALLLLTLLALTSNNWSIRKLGFVRWKHLHHSAYAVQGLVFLHMALQGGSTLIWGCAIFLPLIVLQRLRLQR